MYCAHCGKQIEVGAKICSSCGEVIEGEGKAKQIRAPGDQDTLEAGRGVLILTLGILSVVLLGPILGIPAWVMGNLDIKKVKAGLLAPSERGFIRSGVLLGIVGTFLSPFTILLVTFAISLGSGFVSGWRTQADKDAIIIRMNDIAAHMYQYRIRESKMGGGNGSYLGYRIPDRMREADNEEYQLLTVAPDRISIQGVSKKNNANAVACWIDAQGRMGPWAYSGRFDGTLKESPRIGRQLLAGEKLVGVLVASSAVNASLVNTPFANIDRPIRRLKVYVDREMGLLTITFDFDVTAARRMMPQLEWRHFLIRLFDKNGQYLTHFVTAEWYVADATLLSRRGMKLALLREEDNLLTYPINLRDAAFTEMVEIGSNIGS